MLRHKDCEHPDEKPEFVPEIVNSFKHGGF